MPRPPSDRPYACGPEKHRRQWRITVYTPRSGGGRTAVRRVFETEAAAKTWKREFRRSIAAAGRSVGDAVAEYLVHLREHKGNKERSVATSGYRLRSILDYDAPISDLNRIGYAQDLYDDMIEEGYERGQQLGKKYAPDTHHNALMEAKAFVRFCMKKSWLTFNRFDNVEAKGKKRRRKKQLRVDEARKLAKHCMKEWAESKDRTAIAALLPLQFNLRASEVAQLVARDVDDRGRLLWVAYNEDEVTGDDMAKSDSSRRTVSVPPHLVPILRELAEHPATKDGHLFAKAGGEPADRHWVRYWVIEHSKDAGVPPVTTHGLRGTWSSLKRSEGYDDERIAREMGHADRGETARQHYVDPAIAAEAQTRQVAKTIFEDVPEPVDPEETPRIER
jgi:integrase